MPDRVHGCFADRGNGIGLGAAWRDEALQAFADAAVELEHEAIDVAAFDERPDESRLDCQVFVGAVRDLADADDPWRTQRSRKCPELVWGGVGGCQGMEIGGERGG